MNINRRKTVKEKKKKLTKDAGGVTEDRAKDSKIASRNRNSLNNNAFITLNQLRLPRPIKPHPKPRRSTRLLLSSTLTPRSNHIQIIIIYIIIIHSHRRTSGSLNFRKRRSLWQRLLPPP